MQSGMVWRSTAAHWCQLYARRRDRTNRYCTGTAAKIISHSFCGASIAKNWISKALTISGFSQAAGGCPAAPRAWRGGGQRVESLRCPNQRPETRLRLGPQPDRHLLMRKNLGRNAPSGGVLGRRRVGWKGGPDTQRRSEPASSADSPGFSDVEDDPRTGRGAAPLCRAHRPGCPDLCSA